jgi:class 3 adenylate cyclase/CheY-like chemotaxis protein
MQLLKPEDFLLLVVDDNRVNLRFISVLLQRTGYQVITANNGLEALACLQTQQPDLILLDIMMPGMDGYEVCERLKEDAKTSYIPIIFLSALDETLDKVKAFEIGGADFVGKPFQSAEVLARIKNQLRLQALQRELHKQNVVLQEQIEARRKAEAELRDQKEQAERLLLNILPVPIAQRLKENQKIIADSFTDVSVLFADLVNFTELSAQKESTELVSMLNQIFSAFDELTDQNDLEKIKTIGDAYMVVGGLPLYRADHAEAVAQMALDMQTAIGQFNQTMGETFHLRIGIHLGPVTAGVIGKKKFIYDLWGDTVNVASRMESSGVTNKIQVTEAVYQRLKQKFDFTERGSISIKGKGEMTTYFLLERR